MDAHTREKMRLALVGLRVACDDGDAVAEDMLRAPRKRALGPALHAQNYREARGKVVTGIAYLMRALANDGGEHGDPSGNGGAGPTH